MRLSPARQNRKALHPTLSLPPLLTRDPPHPLVRLVLVRYLKAAAVAL